MDNSGTRNGIADLTEAATPLSETQSRVTWKHIRFHMAHEAEAERFKRRWKSLCFTSQEPDLVTVPHGIIEPQRRSVTRGATRVVGVYDENGGAIPASIRTRDIGIEHAHSSYAAAERIKDPRTAYYLGVDAGHYGHFLLETLCRTWAWERAGAAVAVIQAPPLKQFARQIFELVPGLAERVEIVSSTTQFENVIVPAPTFVVARKVFSAFKNLCCHIADRAGATQLEMTDQPVYVSRAGWRDDQKRGILQEAELETFLADQGFRIVRPEVLPVTEQIAMVNRHRWIVAPMGSACHTRIFAMRPTNLLMLFSKLHPNYVLCDSLSEGETHYANMLVPAGPAPGRRISHLPARLQVDSFLNLLRDFGLVSPRANLRLSSS